MMSACWALLPLLQQRQLLTLVLWSVQDKWLVHSGMSPAAIFPNRLSAFDLTTLTWNEAAATSVTLDGRASRMMTCHQDMLVMVEGATCCTCCWCIC